MHRTFLLGLSLLVCLPCRGADPGSENLALRAQASASSELNPQYAARLACDGAIPLAMSHADATELVQMLQKGHHGVKLDAESWDRLSTCRSYPYHDDDGRNTATSEGRKVVRGGSFRDGPQRCRSAFRLDYPAWQKVFNVGFRVVLLPKDRLADAAKPVRGEVPR